MFFTIAQKINNLAEKSNEILNWKIGIIGFLFYICFWLLLKLPFLKVANINNWLLFVLSTGVFAIDGILIAYDFINKVKQLEKNQLHPDIQAQPNNTNENKVINEYETTTELETTQEN